MRVNLRTTGEKAHKYKTYSIEQIAKVLFGICNKNKCGSCPANIENVKEIRCILTMNNTDKLNIEDRTKFIEQLMNKS